MTNDVTIQYLKDGATTLTDSFVRGVTSLQIYKIDIRPEGQSDIQPIKFLLLSKTTTTPPDIKDVASLQWAAVKLSYGPLVIYGEMHIENLIYRSAAEGTFIEMSFFIRELPERRAGA